MGYKWAEITLEVMGVVAGVLFLINILVRGDFFSQAGTNAKDQDLIRDKCLNPPWKDSSNRDLDWKHVQTLRKDFTQGIHRFKPESRLKATTSETSFLKILKAYQQLSGKNMDIPTIKNKAHSGKGSAINNFVFLLELPKDIEQPILQSGQHRRQALLSALEDQAAAAIKDATNVNGEKIEFDQWDWEPKVDDIDEFLGQYTLSLDAQIRRDLEQWQATHAGNPGLSTKLPGEKEPDSAEKQKRRYKNLQELQKTTL
ncbi:hypothetical protein DTO164E3_4018 [Paecilomyces variotii]|nr:hypothetical protein DTO164E3_4018 [Paecilomyces variotii]